MPNLDNSAVDHRPLAAVMTGLQVIFPLGFIAAVVIWALKRDGSSFLDAIGKEIINFQLTLFLALIAAKLLCVILIGFPLLFLIGVASIVLIVVAAFKALQGEVFHYPSIRFLK